MKHVFDTISVKLYFDFHDNARPAFNVVGASRVAFFFFFYAGIWLLSSVFIFIRLDHINSETDYRPRENGI